MTYLRKYFYGDFGDKEETNAQNQLKQEAFNQRNDITTSQELSTGKTPSTGGGLGEASWPLWEVFIRSKQGLDHKHVGSLHAPDAQMAVENARDVYTRRNEGVSIWVVESKHIHASNPDDAENFYDPANDKIYRHPTFYDLPDEVKHM
jgi:ring-1,2-phenylacetyl-CoA epoxidase subunit PaaB